MATVIYVTVIELFYLNKAGAHETMYIALKLILLWPTRFSEIRYRIRICLALFHLGKIDDVSVLPV